MKEPILRLSDEFAESWLVGTRSTKSQTVMSTCHMVSTAVDARVRYRVSLGEPALVAGIGSNGGVFVA